MIRFSTASSRSFSEAGTPAPLPDAGVNPSGNDSSAICSPALVSVLLTSFLFPPGLVQNFYARFELPQGAFTAVGTCHLHFQRSPPGRAGHRRLQPQVSGVPGRLPGRSRHQPLDSEQGDSEHAMEWVEDPPTQEVR